jgi:hypothetical protein
MSPEKDTANAITPLFVISGRIESSEQVAVSKQDNFPIIHTLIKGKAVDEYSHPPQWLVISKVRFGKKDEIVSNIKTEVRCRSYLADSIDKQTGQVIKVRRFTHDLWLAQ